MSADYTVTREGETSGAFVLWQHDRRVGRLDFRTEASTLAIDYVVVDGTLRGQGLGVRLVDAAVAWARETGRPVHAYCGYAARVLRSDPRYRDVSS